MKFLNKLMVLLYDIFQSLGAIVLGVILSTVMAGIVSRYIFNRPFSWTEELCTFMMVYLAYLTAPLATISKEHVVADFFKSLLPPKFERLLSFLIRFFEIAFFVVVCISCIHYIPRRTFKSAVLQIPRAAFYIPVLVGTVVIVVVIIIDLLNDLFPGYNLFKQRQEERERLVAQKEKEEEQAMLARMDSFMDEVEKTVEGKQS